MRKFISNKYIQYLIGILIFILLWWVISLCFDINKMVVPSPLDTTIRMFELLRDPYTYKCLLFTLLKVLIGFSISFVVAFILGVLAGNSKVLSGMLKPTMTVLKSIPTATVVFLFVIIVSARYAPILVTMLISFPILFEAVTTGIANVDKDTIEASKVDGADYVKRNIFIKIPLALPYIGVGLLASFSLSFKVEIMAEVITGYSQNGLGSIIKATQNADPTDMVTIFGYSLIAIIVVLIISISADVIKDKIKKKVN